MKIFCPEPQALSWMSFCSFWTLPSLMFSQGFGNLTKSGKTSCKAFPVTSKRKCPCSPSLLGEVVQRIGAEELAHAQYLCSLSLGHSLWEAHTPHSFTSLSPELPYEGKGVIYLQPWNAYCAKHYFIFDIFLKSTSLL